MTVKEYAELKGQSLAAIYKQIAENRIKFKKKFGRLVVVVDEKSESVKAWKKVEHGIMKAGWQ